MLLVSRVLRRSRTIAIGSCQAACAKFTTTVESQGHILEVSGVLYERCKSFPRFCQTVFIGRRMISSKANAKSTEEEDDSIEDGFSELDAANSAQETSREYEIQDELASEYDIEETQDDLAISDDESDGPIKSRRKKAATGLFKAITTVPGQSVSNALDKWCDEGKELTRAEVSRTFLSLRRRRMLAKALQLSEWLEANAKWEFDQRDYVCRFDLIAKVQGLQKAEAYIKKTPEFVSREVVYRTFLANCVIVSDVKKSEEVFNKMKELELPITVFDCNQLLLLYRKAAKKKVSDVLLIMEKENVKPNAYTFLILIDLKGLSNDITGMDQIVDRMKAEGVEPSLRIKAALAKHYASAGLDEKADKVLKELEGEKSTRIRGVCSRLLLVYAQLGKADEVERIWKMCKWKTKLAECIAAIEAFGRINKIEKAEAVFERVLRTWKYVNSRTYLVLLKVYVEHKMVSKGKDLIKRTVDSGCKIGPLTWDELVKLYGQAGEVEEADRISNIAVEQNQTK